MLITYQESEGEMTCPYDKITETQKAWEWYLKQAEERIDEIAKLAMG